MYLSQSQISGWRRKYCLRRRYKGHRIRRFSKGLSRHILVRQSLSAVFHGALTKSRPAIVPESAPFKTARSVCSGESTLCPLDWRRKDFLFHPLTNVCSPEMSRELFTAPPIQWVIAQTTRGVVFACTKKAEQKVTDSEKKELFCLMRSIRKSIRSNKTLSQSMRRCDKTL